MEYYELRISEENKIWRKYFVYDELFLDNYEEVQFSEAYKNGRINALQIQALSDDGCVVKEEAFFQKQKMPEFSVIQRLLLIRDDIIDASYFSDLENVSFCEIKVDGAFSKNYKLLNFATAINCIDDVNSEKASIDFFSTLVLDSSKIPNNINGFFLYGWDKYNHFVPIVSDSLKDKLSTLSKANDFLIFDKVEVR